MKRIILTTLLLLLSVPAFAGQYEDALRTGSPVFLYLHTKECKHCKTFNPIFDKIAQNYKNNYRFVKVDANTPYGNLLMRDFRATYVPFVLMVDAKRQYMTSVTPDCLIDEACMEKQLKGFLK